MQSKTTDNFLFLDTLDRYIHEIKSLNMHKLFIISCVSFWLMAVQKWVEAYLFHDWSFLISLFILIAIDTITGFMKAFKQGVVSSAKFGRIFVKIFLYCLVLIVVNVLISFKVDGSHPVIFDWIETFMFTALMFREAVSIFENIALVYPTLLPKFVMKKLAQFDESGFEIKNEDKEAKEEELKK